ACSAALTYKCRHASVLASHRFHANTHLPIQPQTLQNNRPLIQQGYPIHVVKGESTLIDPLQYILKDSTSKTNYAENGDAHIINELQSALQSATRVAESLVHVFGSDLVTRGVKWEGKAARLGRVVSDTRSSVSGGGRTIELEVTPAQLHKLLMMRAPASSLVPNNTDAMALANNNSKGKYIDGLYKSNDNECGYTPMSTDSILDKNDVIRKWSLATAAAMAFLGVSTFLGLDSDLHHFNKMSSIDVSNILCCS
ncbi:hypothetical protein LPJ66_005314, partial [Kickxella alabastrina]